MAASKTLSVGALRPALRVKLNRSRSFDLPVTGVGAGVFRRLQDADLLGHRRRDELVERDPIGLREPRRGGFTDADSLNGSAVLLTFQLL